MATERRTDTSKQIPTNWYMTVGGLVIDILVQVNKSDSNRMVVSCLVYMYEFPAIISLLLIQSSPGNMNWSIISRFW